MKRKPTESQARRIAENRAPWCRPIASESSRDLSVWIGDRSRRVASILATMADLGHPRHEPTVWTEAEKQADRLTEIEEMSWLSGRHALVKAMHEACDAMDREDERSIRLFATTKRRAA